MLMVWRLFGGCQARIRGCSLAVACAFFFGKGLRGMAVEVRIVNLLGFLLYFFFALTSLTWRVFCL